MLRTHGATLITLATAGALLLLFCSNAVRAAPEGAKAASPVHDIPRMAKIVIDGKADDWGDGGFRVDLLLPVGAAPKAIKDHSAKFRLGWNKKGLLVLAIVRDDKWIEHEDTGWLWRYDGVEMFLAREPGASDYCQWTISPGMTAKQKKLRWKLHDHRVDKDIKKRPARLTAARTKTPAGYVLEAIVPWICLSIVPRLGTMVGFQITINDADEIDGDTSHAAWYQADNTSADSNKMHTVRLARKGGNPIQAGGRWTCVWPAQSRATIYTTAALVNKQLTVRVDGKAVARSTVKAAATGGMATLEIPIGLPPTMESVDLHVGNERTGTMLVPYQAKNRETWKMDVNQIRKKLMDCELRTSATSGLLFDAADIKTIRERAAKRKMSNPRILFETGSVMVSGDRSAQPQPLTKVLRQYADSLRKSRPDDVNREFIFNKAHDARLMAIACFFLRDKAYVEWTKRRVKALLAMDNWKHPLNDKTCPHLDHLAARVGACIAIANDLLGDAYSEAESREIAEVVRKRHILNFIDACRGRKEWWASEECESNWTIMTCGDSGLVACHFGRFWPQAEVREALAARGVLDTLDLVPAAGDWPEGVNYWFVTMGMGVRFGHALRRMTKGEIDLLRHPALKTTGDFPTMLTSPGLRIYQFNDNNDMLEGLASQTLMLLAREFDRKDWMHIARQSAVNTPLYLLLDDPAIKSKRPSKLTAVFPRTGVATIRSGWDKNDTFVGVKCGPSDVGHSHLDAASFVIESKGVPLVIDPGTWPYAGQIGYYDDSGPRWNWDALATVGHSTLLIDGKGQTWGSDHPGRIVSVDKGAGWSMVVADASKTYPELLKKFVRTVLLIGSDTVIIRDVVECEGLRHAEWLLHYDGKMRDEGLVSVVESQGVSLRITPLLPDRAFGWRQSDVVRKSVYPNQVAESVERSIPYRSFAPFRKSKKFEFLFAMRINGKNDGSDWKFEGGKEGWRLQAGGHKLTVQPKGDSLVVGE